MGHHSLPDDSAATGTGARPRPRPRRRTVTIATAVALAVAAGSVVALRSDLLPFGTPCGGSSVEVNVVASPDIAPALDTVAKKARDDATRTDGKCLDVRVHARPANEVADSLGQRPASPEFQVWIPDSSLWVERVADEGGSSLTTAGTIASSPITLGAVPSAAKALGWPGKTYTWAALTRAATSGSALRLGVADPTRSATGLLALARTDAANHKEAKDGDEAAGRTAATAELLYERVADGDRQALATLPRDDSAAEQRNPRRNQALLLSEQAAYAHNTTAGGPTLDLLYPEDGAAQLDYPYTLVNNEELTADQSRAANRFMTLLDDTDGQRTLRGHGFRSGNGTPDPKPIGAAGGRGPQPYAAAPADPPPVRELKALLGMWTVTVHSTRITTAVDVSAATALPVPGKGGRSRLDLAKDSLLQTLNTFTPDDEVGLWKFAAYLDGTKDYVELSPTGRLGDRGATGGTHRDELATALRSLTPVPRAAGLYDTMLAAYRQARATYASGKFNALVIVTDAAHDDSGGIGQDTLVADLERLSDTERPVPLIAVAIGPNADQAALDRMVSPTGGSAHLVGDPSQLRQVILKALTAAGSHGPHH
ncbi:substrate-binding and VWA domain-containing protein [Streptomyces sp. CT34]|uniref:substrate-binding and VWA domain-containing protein n=1 Tax=Streptomyces sp. CT34 TaxID=1553907 RepID=UPI0005B81654|nr:substrate-binding and VWA domain-containing protein [Streptomyces sp. CT34]